jgi:hypothetical protein
MQQWRPRDGGGDVGAWHGRGGIGHAACTTGAEQGRGG